MEHTFLTAGERCITISFGNEVSLRLNSYVKQLNSVLIEDPICGVLETVPTYCSLSVHFDPSVIRRDKLISKLDGRIRGLKPAEAEDTGYKEIPVYYGGETGPDLEYCAALEGISCEELIRRHSSYEYYVFQLGFSPGHPYMARMEEPFSFGRRETPRVDIPARSVVVQKNLTNITPFRQACGWNIIGSTPIDITDMRREDPFFFKAGDHVRIRPVDKAEYDRIRNETLRLSGEKYPDRAALPKSGKGEDAGFTVEAGGALTTIQDEGRFNYQAGGISPAGPMDHRAFHLANIIAGNPRDAAALEITMQGPVLRFDKDAVIALTGADLSPCINGRAAVMYSRINVAAGDVLSFGRRVSGCRAYAAFAGGIQEKKVLGSNATDLKNCIGGHEGRALKKGDRIGLAGSEGRNGNRRALQIKTKVVGKAAGSTQGVIYPDNVYPADEIVLRVVAGPQQDSFTQRGIRDFFNYSAVITDRSDRQGMRLDTKPIEFVNDCNIISDGICMGAIQVTGDGKPIILLADRQSVGGYAKIGTVIYVDLPKLAQAVPGMKVRFVRVSAELAQELYIREMDYLKDLEEYYVQY